MSASIWLAVMDAHGTLSGVGRARKVGRATVLDGAIVDWEEFEVKWDEAHQPENEGLHHARIAKFFLDHRADWVLAAGAGPDMRRMLEHAGIRLTLGGGNAREAVAHIYARAAARPEPAASPAP